MLERVQIWQNINTHPITNILIHTLKMHQNYDLK